MVPTKSKQVRTANQASSSELASSLRDQDVPNKPDLLLQVFCASDLGNEVRDNIWSIFEENMKDLYAASTFGWNPSEKRGELFHKMSRFLLMRERRNSDGSKSAPGGPVIAYSMFRFEVEDKEDVVYCYEMQVHRSIKRAGIGRYLVQQLLTVGKYWGMNKTMLTVFKANSEARKFYTAMGFKLDPTSPEYPTDDWEGEDDEDGEDGSEERDYEILSMCMS